MYQRFNYIMAVCVALSFVLYMPQTFGQENQAGSGQAKQTAKKDDKKQAVQKAAGAKTDTLVVTARIVEIPGKFAPNDLYNYVYIMKYRILKVEKGTYTEKEMLVGISRNIQ